MTDYLVLDYDHLLGELSDCIKTKIDNSTYCVKNLEEFDVSDMMKLNAFIIKNSTLKLIKNKDLSGKKLIDYVNTYYFSEKTSDKKNECETQECITSWEALKMQLGDYFTGEIILLYKFFYDKSRLKTIYERYYGGNFTYILHADKWTDPYMAHLVMIYYNLPSTFVLVNPPTRFKLFTQFNENMDCVNHYDLILELSDPFNIMVGLDTKIFTAKQIKDLQNFSASEYMIHIPKYIKFKTLNKHNYYRYDAGLSILLLLQLKTFKKKPDKLSKIKVNIPRELNTGIICSITYHKIKLASCEFKASNTNIRIIENFINNTGNDEFLVKLIIFVSHFICELDQSNKTYKIVNPTDVIRQICKSIGWKETNSGLEYGCEIHHYICGSQGVPSSIKVGEVDVTCWFDTATTLMFTPTNLSRYLRKKLFETKFEDDSLKLLKTEYSNLVKRIIKAGDPSTCSNILNSINKIYKTKSDYNKYKKALTLSEDGGSNIQEYLEIISKTFNNILETDYQRHTIINCQIKSGFLFWIKNKPKISNHIDKRLSLLIDLKDDNILTEINKYIFNINEDRHNTRAYANIIENMYNSKYLIDNLDNIVELISDVNTNEILKISSDIYNMHIEDILNNLDVTDKKNLALPIDDKNKTKISSAKSKISRLLRETYFEKNSKLTKLIEYGIYTTKNDIMDKTEPFRLHIERSSFISKYYENQLKRTKLIINTNYFFILSVNMYKTQDISEEIIVCKEKYKLDSIFISDQLGVISGKEVAHQVGIIKCEDEWYLHNNQDNPPLAKLQNYNNKLKDILSKTQIKSSGAPLNLNIFYVKSFPT